MSWDNPTYVEGGVKSPYVENGTPTPTHVTDPSPILESHLTIDLESIQVADLGPSIVEDFMEWSRRKPDYIYLMVRGRTHSKKGLDTYTW